MQTVGVTPLFLRPKPLAPVKRDLSKEEQEEIRFTFETLDFDKQGVVTQKHVKVALRAMGFPVKKADVLELLRRHGEEENDRLDFDTFRRVVADKLSERTPQDDMKRAFQLFDMQGIGKVDLPTLRRIVKSLGLDIDEQELRDMIAEFDTDNDGMISEAEFMAIMTAADE